MVGEVGIDGKPPNWVQYVPLLRFLKLVRLLKYERSMGRILKLMKMP